MKPIIILSGGALGQLKTGDPFDVNQGGTGSNTPTGARKNLGLEIGVNVQRFSETLNILADLGLSPGLLVHTGEGFEKRSIDSIDLNVENSTGENGNIILSLKNSGVTAGTYPKVTVDAKGRVTGGSSLQETDVPQLDWSKIKNKPTTIAGYGIVDAQGSGSYLTENQTISVSGDASGNGKTSINLTLSNSGVTAGTYPKVTVDAKGRVTGGSTLSASDIPALDASKITGGTMAANTTGNASTSTKLATARTISINGDASWTVSFDGSGDVISNLTFSNSGVTAGTYPKVTVDAKGRVTGGSTLSASDIPVLDWSKITTGKPTTVTGYGITLSASDIPVLDWAKITTGKPTTVTGYGITDAFSQGADIPASVDLDTYTTTGWYHQNLTSNAGTGTNYPTQIAGLLSVFADGNMIYQTYRSYATGGSVYYRTRYNGTWSTWQKIWTNESDGSGSGLDADLLDGKQSSATATADTIPIRDANGKLPGDILGNSATTTKLSTSRKINGVAFDGTSDITINAVDSTVRIASTEKGAANGVATLDASGLVPSSQLPSYVDDVLEYANFASLPASGTTSKIYVTIDTNKIYRWSGSNYIEISPVVGNSDSATKLATARTISITGDMSWTSPAFDGTGNVTAVGTLANSGVTAGTYPKVTVDAKGRVTGGSTLSASDIPALDWTKITTGKPTTRDGYGITDVPKTDGTGASGTWGVNITGNAATATTATNSSKLGNYTLQSLTEFQTNRDFINGTLITTDINYALSSGDPWFLEITGNSYSELIPYDVKVQGYIYSDTLISIGGISNGRNITGLVALNVGGALCFWFPRQAYWQGYTINVNSSYYSGQKVNRLVSVTDVVKPAGTKEVALSSVIRQSLHSDNYNIYCGVVKSNPQSSAYVATYSDIGSSIDASNNVTIPANATVSYPIGTVLTITNMIGSAITILGAAGVTLRMTGTTLTGNRTLGGYGSCCARKVNTDTWYISGPGLS
jgi:phage-related tail fiber protein